MQSDPYQWFFPLGILGGALGTGVWVVFWLAQGGAYPGTAHADLMMCGFFFVVATGFLMTALPKFSGTHSATLIEVLTGVVIAFFMIWAAASGLRLVAHGMLLLESIAMLVFGGRRIRKSQYRLPSAFLFILAGICSVLAGSLILLLGDLRLVGMTLFRFGQLMVFYATSLFMILGVGSQLLTMLMGYEPRSVPGGQRRLRIPVIAVGIVAGFLVEAMGYYVVGRAVVAGLVLFVILSNWKIYRLPPAKTIVARMIWCSIWMTVTGLSLSVVFPEYALLSAHLYFIGGVSLVIFAVATRVVLAHGGHGLDREKTSRALWTVLVLLLVAAATRFTAPFVKGNYQSHLAYAALVWLGAALAWCVVFLPRLFFRKNV